MTKVEAAGGVITATDVTSDEQITDVVEKTIAEHRLIDILVNAAG